MSRRSLLLILRLGVSAAALAVLLPRVAHSWSHVVRWRPTTIGWLVAGTPQLGGRLAHRESWLRFVGAVHVGLERFRRRPATAAAALLAGFAYQLVVVLSVYLASRALGIAAGITALLAFVPVVAIIQVLPISIGGLGVRESAFALFLHPLGVSTAQAVTLGLLMGG